MSVCMYVCMYVCTYAWVCVLSLGVFSGIVVCCARAPKLCRIVGPSLDVVQLWVIHRFTISTTTSDRTQHGHTSEQAALGVIKQQYRDASADRSQLRSALKESTDKLTLSRGGSAHRAHKTVQVASEASMESAASLSHRVPAGDEHTDSADIDHVLGIMEDTAIINEADELDEHHAEAAHGVWWMCDVM